MTLIKDFMFRNLIAFSVFLGAYLIVYIFCIFNLDIYEWLKKLISYVADFFFSQSTAEYIATHTLIIYAICCGWFFVFNFIGTSVSTFINFTKIYRSLDAFTDSEAEIAVFPKKYSGIEIKLKDIKLDILEKQNLLTDSENKRNDLVMYLAHDLKTPLTSVIGYLTLLQESPEIPISQRA